MAKTVVTMDVGSGENIAFGIPDYVATYFGIPAAPTTAAEAKLIIRDGFTYVKRALNAADDAGGKSVTVAVARFYRIPRVGGKIAGRKIIVPTKKTTAKGNLMLVTLRIPSSAAILPICKWIFGWNNATTRPEYFQMESGVRYPVRNYTVADVNPGNDTAATTAP